jgi:hypothetical protein
MAVVTIPSCWSVALIYQYEQSKLRAENTLGILDGGAHTIERAAVVAKTVTDWWQGNLKPLQSPDVSLIQTYVLDISSATGISLEYVEGLPLPGSGTGAAAPSPSAPIVTFRALGRGRSYRGRNYIVGSRSAHDYSDDGTFTDPDAANAYTIAYQALGSALDAEDMKHAILSRKLVKGLEVVSYEVRTYVGTQRRRTSRW